MSPTMFYICQKIVSYCGPQLDLVIKNRLQQVSLHTSIGNWQLFPHGADPREFPLNSRFRGRGRVIQLGAGRGIHSDSCSDFHSLFI